MEWQCKWLELRMKEVNGHVTRYERMLRAIEAAKKRDAEASRRAGSSGGAPVDLAAAAKKAEAAAKEAEGVAAEVDAESGGLGTPRRANGGGVRMKRRRDHTGHTPPAGAGFDHAPSVRPRRRGVDRRIRADGAVETGR